MTEILQQCPDRSFHQHKRTTPNPPAYNLTPGRTFFLRIFYCQTVYQRAFARSLQAFYKVRLFCVITFSPLCTEAELHIPLPHLRRSFAGPPDTSGPIWTCPLPQRIAAVLFCRPDTPSSALCFLYSYNPCQSDNHTHHMPFLLHCPFPIAGNPVLGQFFPSPAGKPDYRCHSRFPLYW